jgi:hypothetical protein
MTVNPFRFIQEDIRDNGALAQTAIPMHPITLCLHALHAIIKRIWIIHIEEEMVIHMTVQHVFVVTPEEMPDKEYL